MKWTEVQVETTLQAQEAVSDLMMENGCAGTVIQGEDPLVVKCYLPVDDRIEDRLLRIKEGVGRLSEFGLEPGSGEVTVTFSVDEDWAEIWKEYFRTTRVGEHFVIQPSWEQYDPQPGDVVIRIDPGMAFGTGYHPTTQLCLQLMERYMKPRSLVVDFGTGSGILAIAAAKLRASLVIAFDSDETAVQAARRNVIHNAMEEFIEVHRAADSRFINVQVDVVIANLIADTIIAHAKDLAGLLRIGGVLIASGVVKGRHAEVEQSLKAVGLQIVETLTEDEWVAILARKTEG